MDLKSTVMDNVAKFLAKTFKPDSPQWRAVLEKAISNKDGMFHPSILALQVLSTPKKKRPTTIATVRGLLGDDALSEDRLMRFDSELIRLQDEIFGQSASTCSGPHQR